MTSEENMMLDELLELEEGLDEWSLKFIEDISQRRTDIGPDFRLSVKQSDKVRELWEKHCD